MNGFFVALFKKNSNIGTGCQSCVEFQFSPPAAAVSYEKSNTNQTKSKKNAKKRNLETGDQWPTVGSKDMSDSIDHSIVPLKKAKKVRDGRMLTLWKPKKRR